MVGTESRLHAGVSTKAALTHADLVLLAERWLWRQNCGIVMRDAFKAVTKYGEVPDAIGWRHTVSILIECKASRADFLADRAKPFRADPAKGVGDWRFYLCPTGLIKPEDLPDGWGLLYVAGNKISAVVGLPPNTRWGTRKPFTGYKIGELQMLYSALRRFAVRGRLGVIYLRLDERMDIPDIEIEAGMDPCGQGSAVT